MMSYRNFVGGRSWPLLAWWSCALLARASDAASPSGTVAETPIAAAVVSTPVASTAPAPQEMQINSSASLRSAEEPLTPPPSPEPDPALAPAAASNATNTVAATDSAPSAEAPPVLPPSEPGTDAAAASAATHETNGTESTPSSQAKPTSAVGDLAEIVADLVNLEVQQGTLKKDKGDALIQRARADAEQAGADAQVAAAQGGNAPASSANDMNVDYVPKPVEDKIRSDLKQDVMDQAREENWAAPRQLPAWLNRISFFGDFRFRYEGDFFPDGNINPDFGNQIINFNAINTGSPQNFATSPSPSVPTYNVDQNRMRIRVRARLGLNADLGSGFTSGFRIASGSDDSPVTENQSLGAASGQGGNFAKYNVWIDRAFLKKEWGGAPTDFYDASVTIGRFDNPFFHTSMIWADDLGFDGAAVQAKYQMVDGFTPFFNGGIFPVFNTDLNFGTNSTLGGEGYSSEDKWLFAAQFGATWKINDDFSLKVAGAFYDFDNIQGEVSTPIDLSNDSPSPVTVSGYNGNTDDSRPGFAQFGNTYIPLRNYINGGLVTNNPALYNQYYGLATAFREAAFTGQLDYSRFDPFHVSLVGELVKNVAFDRNAILNSGPTFGGTIPSGPINNLSDPSTSSSFAGGDLGWLLRLNLGKVSLEKLWDWNVNVGYRYVQSDATVDGFADSDFGGYINGTNLKGYTVGGNLAFSQFVWAGLRWMSADTIGGPTLKDDTLQFDINAKF